jgi:hypothetical protein
MGWAALEGLFVFTIPFPSFESHQVILGWAFSGFLAVGAVCAAEPWIRKDRLRALFAVVLLAAFVIAQFSSFGHLAERKRERGAQDYARNALELMEPNALFVPYEENEYFPVAGYQQSFHFRKDIEVIEPGTSPSVIGPKIRECVERGRPLYLTRKWEGLPKGWAFQPRGPLLQVTSEPAVAAVRRGASVKPLASWGNLELLGAGISPRQVPAGGRIEVAYRWARDASAGEEPLGAVAVLFADEKGNYWMKDGVLWLHDIHEIPIPVTTMGKDLEYLEKRVLFIPSDFPEGTYQLVVGLQRQIPLKNQGRESFVREFYERSGAQNLDKFTGRGENQAVVQFSTTSSPMEGGGFWPVTKSSAALTDPRFVPAGTLEIKKASD